MQVQRRIAEVKHQQLVIELPESFVHHMVEVIILTIDEESPVMRRPHPDIAGKMHILGDVLESVPNADWDMPR